MKIQHSVRYDAPVGEVYAMLTDPAFRERASQAQEVISLDVTVEGESVNIDMVQPNTDIPSFARKFAGETSHAIQAEQWSQGTTAEFSVTIPGKPGSITGTRRLVADGDATLDTFDGEATARIPLIGGKIEKLIADKLKDGWNTEHGVGVAWLEGNR
ncbi:MULTISPECIES: DUF2505 domain-containing protein [unclassified Nocardioides]|uniref:DUF2505 domain-containing protein n=1 Tax=unclassified Nocardioides TaxID=2615069 RepID=UPI0006F85376|nr:MULTISPECIES: DUF2505 domain-containing protein [unclassified Nocardioides]KQY56462.1 hypothetical protein ASD30_08965 [Nocardioides sp. Root140]KQZ75220.1 hypothetical protein ASD66_02275 [Nocardioides sp. Root151]KRF14299.1 hypothetical protein ASH02_08075 [Nocardioides sp. Soil796]